MNLESIEELPESIWMPDDYGNVAALYTGAPVEMVAALAVDIFGEQASIHEVIDFSLAAIHEMLGVKVRLSPDLSEEDRSALFVAVLLALDIAKLPYQA